MMNIFILGIILWTSVHLIPVFLPGPRILCIKALTENGYKSVFSLLLILALYLMINGWENARTAMIYSPPDGAPHATASFVLLGFILFFAPYIPTNIKRLFRHPQMTGVFFWALGHLLSNGEQRSVILFAAMLVWAIATIVGASRRDGPWQKPDKFPLKGDVIIVAIGLAAYGGAALAHGWLIGVSPLPGV